MKFIDIDLDGRIFRARLLEERSPDAVEALWRALPFEGRAAHGQWSGEVFRMLEHAPIDETPRDRGVGFQYPGLVVLEPNAREIAICYGQGRLNLPTVPLNPIPVAEIGGDLGPLAEFGASLQWQGARPIAFRRSGDQETPLEPPPEPKGQRIEVILAGTVATAVLLEEISPQLTASFKRLLPLSGMATNTISSGPLTRFWNPSGGPEGETVLEVGEAERGQVLLYPGYIYYLPTPPWRGLRIAREATMMRGPAGNGGLRLIPLARFVGDWTGFRAEAERIVVEGAKPLSFRLL